MSDYKKEILVFLFFTLGGITGYSQIEYLGKVETGYSHYIFRSVLVDPGPGWLGYYLNEEQNGAEISLINGIKLNKTFGAGIGFGYLNYEGIDGFSAFANIERLPKRTKLSSIANLKVGYNHIWNQYENGSGSVILEISAGGNYQLSEDFGIYLQVGISGTLEALFIPIRIGARF